MKPYNPIEIGVFSKNALKIQIVLSYSDKLNNEMVVTNFKKAFEIEILEKKEWEEKRLCINVDSLTDEEANIEYEQNLEKWHPDKNGITIDKEDAIDQIKNTIHFKIFSKMNIKILDNNAFELVAIHSKLSNK